MTSSCYLYVILFERLYQLIIFDETSYEPCQGDKNNALRVISHVLIRLQVK